MKFNPTTGKLDVVRKITSETDPVFSASEAANFAVGDAAKLAGIEAGAEVNNATDGTTDGQLPFWNGLTWTYTETSEMFWDDTEKVLTFGNFPITPSEAPTTDYQVANKKYVDDNSGGASAMSDLSDVDLTDIANNKILKYNSGTLKWECEDESAGAETDPIVGAINGIVKADGAGAISAAVADTDYQTVPTEGAFEAGDKTKLDGIATGADVTSANAPKAHAASHVNGTDDIQDATAAQKGLATATQITKLDGIEAAADVTDATNVASSGALMTSTVDAKGDILVASADNTVTRLAVGANSKVLSANDATATGLEWVSAGTPDAHAASHENAGTDEISIAGLSGIPADIPFTPASASAPASIYFAEDTDNGTNKITVTAPSAVATDKIITLPDATGTVALLEIVYPIGSVYTNYSDPTNPATLLGIGTWVAIEGEVVVGFKSGDADFGTAGSAVGAKTSSVAHTHAGGSHTLTAAESGLPSHLHTVNPPATDTDNDTHTHGVYYSANAGASGTVQETIASSGTVVATTSDTHNHSVNIAQFDSGSVTAANASSAHDHGNTGAMSANATPSIIQPSRVCYVWQRSA